MKLHNVNQFPSQSDDNWREYSYYDLDKLYDSDEELLERDGFEEAWYWYATGSYEGTGELIGRGTDGRWTVFSLGHCSCYGPIEDRGTSKWYDTIEEMTEGFTPERLNEIQPLLDAIKKP